MGNKAGKARLPREKDEASHNAGGGNRLVLKAALFLLAVIAALLTAVPVFWVSGTVPESENARFHTYFPLQTLGTARSASGDVVVMANSRGSLAILGDVIQPPFSARLGASGPGRKFMSIYLMGGFPRAFRYILETLDYSCVNPGGTIVYMITPMEMNKNNRYFRNSMLAYFGAKEVLAELVPYGQFNYVVDYLSKKPFDIQGHVDKIRQDMFGLNPGSDELQDSLWQFKNWYYYKYAVSDYQYDSIIRMIKTSQSRGLRFILVVMPLSGTLRDLLGAGNLSDYMARMKELGKRYHIPVIDYISGFDGSEYGYSDFSHLDDGSKIKFADNLIGDLDKNLPK
jgi:hypothetical protein